MNRDVVETQWVQVREVIRDRFSNLSDEDLRQINGRYDQLISKLQQKYGYTREEAEDKVRNLNFDRYSATSKSYRDDSRARDDSSSIFKWLLAIGIPLLLALWLYNSYGPTTAGTTTTTNATAQEQFVAETPADRIISNGIRDRLAANQDFASDIANLQIRTNNAVVTLSGTVPDRETHDFAVATARNFNGVSRVVDNIQVR